MYAVTMGLSEFEIGQFDFPYGCAVLRHRNGKNIAIGNIPMDPTGAIEDLKSYGSFSKDLVITSSL